MTRETEDPDVKHFDEHLRAWGSRPTPTSAERAAARVRARLEESAPRRWARWPALAAAAVLAALLFAVRPPGDLPTPGSDPAVPEAPKQASVRPALPEDVVLIQLDPRTPLYLTLPTAAPAPGREPTAPSGPGGSA